METMRKMTSKLAASVLAVLLATAVMLWLPALTQAKAAEVRQPDEIENFDGDSLGARWEKAGDAEMNAGKSVLRFNRPNVWQPTVKPINYKAEETADTASYSLSIDYEILDGSGWMGIAFGMTAQTGHFYEAGIMFMITQSGGVSVWKGNAARNGLEAVDALAFSVPAPAAGVVYTYRIDAVKRAGTEPANRYYDFEFYAGVKGGLLQKAGTAADFVGSNHFGFASMGSLLAEISRVDFEVLASDGTTKLAELHEDFTSSASRLQYPGETTDYEWAVSAITDGAPRTAFFMGTMKELAFEDAKTGKIYSKEAFVPDTRVSSPLEVSYKIKLTYLDDGAYFGLGTGMASAAAALDGSNLIYFKRTALSTQIGLLKNGTEHQNTVISQTLAINDDTVILYSFRYAGGAYDVDIYFNGVWAGALTGVNINGHYGVGVISDGTAAVSLLLDDLTTRASRYADQSYSADIGVTETIDFKGTRERVAGTETFVTPYYNTSKWFASGNGVLPPRNTDPLDKQSLEFNITAGAANVVAAFGPTKTYADYVLRYTFKVTDADSGWLGISLARPSLEAQISAAPLIKFTKNGAGMTVSSERLNGGTFSDTQSSFFDTAKSFDVMVTVNNGIVTVYYSETGAADYAPKAVFTDVPSYGFVALTGAVGSESAVGAKYKVTRLSITEANDSYTLTDETKDAANRSAVELNDYAASAFSNDYINETRWTVGKGIAVDGGALRFTDTKKNATFATVGQFGSFALNFDITAKNAASDIVLAFGQTAQNPAGSKIIFKAGSAKVALIGLENAKGQTDFDLPVNIYGIAGVVNVKLVVLGGSVKLYIKAADEPIAAFAAPVAALSFLTSARSSGSVVFGTGDGGNMTIDNVRILSLEYNIDIVTENYDGTNKPALTAPETVVPPGDGGGCGSIAGTAAAIPAALSAIIAAVLLKKKRSPSL